VNNKKAFFYDSFLLKNLTMLSDSWGPWVSCRKWDAPFTWNDTSRC